MSDIGNGCQNIRPLLEAYFEGVLSPREERRVVAHLWQCPRCTAEMEQIRRLAMTLEALPRLEPAAQLARSISDRIASLPAAAQRRNVWVGWRRLGLAAAAAVAVMTALFYALAPFVPGLYAVVGRLWGYASGVAARIQVAAEALLPLGPVAKSLAAALLEAARASASTLLTYTVAEVIVLVVITLLIQRGHLRAAASS